MDISDISPAQRLVIGVVLVTVGPTLAQPNLGWQTRISGILTVLGIGFLGLTLEPAMTTVLGADEWSDLSTGKQIVVLFVLSVVALVLWFALVLLKGALASAV